MLKEELFIILENRFNEHKYRHQEILWQDIKTILEQKEELVDILIHMEETKGEPDFIMYQNKIIAVDFSKETPLERRNVCYDQEARLSRKKFPPNTSAFELAKEMGISILDEELYRYIQKIEPLDLKTSSWLKTNENIRQLGGAIFGDCRYKNVFIYHNGADSYYGVRGFRGFVRL